MYFLYLIHSAFILVDVYPGKIKMFGLKKLIWKQIYNHKRYLEVCKKGVWERDHPGRL